jgi:hypothetical protein
MVNVRRSFLLYFFLRGRNYDLTRLYYIMDDIMAKSLLETSLIDRDILVGDRTTKLSDTLCDGRHQVNGRR